MPSDILEIRMQKSMIDCSICGGPDAHSWGVPVVNGDIVSNDFPDEIWRREGGAIGVCEECYRKHERGEIPTFDRFYLHLRPGFTDGAGI